jgi:hypothetical protein
MFCRELNERTHTEIAGLAPGLTSIGRAVAFKSTMPFYLTKSTGLARHFFHQTTSAT